MNANALFNDFAQGLREQYAATKPELKDGSEVAVFIGNQETIDPHKPMALFNLLEPLGVHPVGSTVGKETLAKHGYAAPSMAITYKAHLIDRKVCYLPIGELPDFTEFNADIYASRSTDDAGELLCN